MQTVTQAPPITTPQARSAPFELVELEQHPMAERAIAQPVTPADLLRVAMERGDGDIERMERLMQMQERFEQAKVREQERQAELAFRRDFAEFTALGLVIQKTKSVVQTARGGGPGPRYDQTEFHVVMQTLKPALGKHGFGVSFDNKFVRGIEGGVAWCSVTCSLEHRDGHVRTMTLEGPPDDSGAKNALQEMQSSATFLMRHAVMAITGTAQAGKDNDGRGARGQAEEEKQEVEAAGDDDRLVIDGKRIANGGTKDLNAWWAKLTEADRKRLTPKFADMRKAARLVDTGGVQ